MSIQTGAHGNGHRRKIGRAARGYSKQTLNIYSCLWTAQNRNAKCTLTKPYQELLLDGTSRFISNDVYLPHSPSPLLQKASNDIPLSLTAMFLALMTDDHPMHGRCLFAHAYFVLHAPKHKIGYLYCIFLIVLSVGLS